MNTTEKKPLENQAYPHPISDRFDFDLWANKVRPQLLAALQKKAGK